jgi:uncharacterized protein (DUF2235 family)
MPLKSFKFMLIVGVLCVTAACTTLKLEGSSEDAKTVVEFKGDISRKKSIFVFLDGTSNDIRSGTNVWRLFNLIRGSGDPQLAAKYIPGVGTSDSPEFSLLGLAFGQGMEARILTGYDFIAKNYRVGDDVFIFGFSRGAHEARSLAGFVSYVGIPKSLVKDTLFELEDWDKILEITKKKSDSEFDSYWQRWMPGVSPPLAAEAREALRVDFQPVQIALLGLWDTVPGSSFKKFGPCKEVEDSKAGDRYKSDSYPSIRSIAHALAADEKRDKFRPLLICPARNPGNPDLKSQINEKWFPGAHADIGGGYSDNDNGLPNLSMNWMIDILRPKYSFLPSTSSFVGNPNGLAHWSVGDMSWWFRIHCEDRVVPSAEESRHPSLKARNGTVLIRVKGQEKRFDYPISCANERELLNAPAIK